MLYRGMHEHSGLGWSHGLLASLQLQTRDNREKQHYNSAAKELGISGPQQQTCGHVSFWCSHYRIASCILYTTWS